MAPYTLLSLSLAVAGAVAQIAEVPLASKRFQYPNELPFKVDTDGGARGFQHGYNICNSTTESQTSDCQTAFLDSAEDFCLWAPPKPDSTIGDTEGEAVAWCTKPGRGTRVIPPGALTGLQFMRTPDYVQVIGTIDQTKINILAGDSGGEMDPHGADLRGNPLGGLFYSNAFSGNKDSYQQVIEWHNFIGSDSFCLKACDPAGPNAAHFCEHIFDRIGCAFNAPSKPFEQIKGTFESCEGDNQDFPGIYTEAGVVKTYTQPAESLGPISVRPYEPIVPPSSNCVPHKSEELYASAIAVLGAAPSATPTAAPSGSASGAAATGKPASGSAPAATGSRAGASAPAATGSSLPANGASSQAVASLSMLVGVVVAVAFSS